MSERVLLVGCGEPSIHAETEEYASGFPVHCIERVLLPGGCWWLAEAASATTGRFRRAILGEYVPVRDSLVRFITESGIGRVILLSHQGCAWYAGQFPGATQGELIKHAGADMFTARDELLRLGPEGLDVEGHIFVTTGENTGFRCLFPSEPLSD